MYWEICSDCCTGIENFSQKTEHKPANSGQNPLIYFEAVAYFENQLKTHYKSLKKAQNATQIENIHRKIKFVREANKK